MDQESNQMEQHPVQCRNGCGFYSNAGTDGLCSVCYKDMIKKKQQQPTNMPASMAPTPSTMASLSIDNEGNSNSSPIKAASSSASSVHSSSTAAASAQSVETGSPTVNVLSSQAEKPSEGAGPVSASGESVSADDSGLEASGSSSAASAVASPVEGDGESGKDGKKKKNRCQECKKKVGLTGFTCRCGGLYCSIHRYSDKHQCDFDYKELGAAEIRKSNPVVVAKKVQQI